MNLKYQAKKKINKIKTWNSVYDNKEDYVLKVKNIII